MMIEKVFLVGVQEGKTTDFVDILRFKPLFYQSAIMNPTKLTEKVYLGVLQHPTNFQAKILTGKFYS